MSRMLGALSALVLLASCAPSRFDARLRAGDTEAALLAFEASEEIRQRPDAMLNAALLLQERSGPGDLEAAQELLTQLVQNHPLAPEARAARLILGLEAERDSMRASRDDLAMRLRDAEVERARLEGRVRELEEELALRESLLEMLSRMAGRLETQLEAERQELTELRRMLEQLMEVDLDLPPVVPPGSPPRPGGGGP